MTTKPKPRKAPAKAAAPAASVKGGAFGEQKREVSEIRKLVSRWLWLEADQEHRSDLAKTENESERLLAIHYVEQEAIESQLATLVPESLKDAYYLLKFVTDKAGGCVLDNAEIHMLKNITASFWHICNAEIDKARKESAAKTKAAVRDSYRWAIETSEQIDDRAAARKAEREAA